jgi:very-short-patch-repair endonuclease
MTTTPAPFLKGGACEAGGGLLPRNKSLKERSQALRKNATRQENHLWYDFLRTQTPRWTRQRVIGNYIVDFYCSARKLVVELDGSQHYEEDAMKYDMDRTSYLGSLGIGVLRFTNLDVEECFDAVCEAILAATNPRQASPATPFGKGGLI